MIGSLIIHDIEGDRAVVGIDDHLDRVANVVDPVAERLAVGIAVARRIGVHDPVELAVIAHDDIGILVEGQERRQQRHALLDVAPPEQLAFRLDVLAQAGY